MPGLLQERGERGEFTRRGSRYKCRRNEKGLPASRPEDSSRRRCSLTPHKHTAKALSSPSCPSRSSILIQLSLPFAVRPESGPRIRGLLPEYGAEDVIDVMCVSSRSYPAPQLDFFIDNEPVRGNNNRNYRTFPSKTNLNRVSQNTATLIQPGKRFCH